MKYAILGMATTFLFVCDLGSDPNLGLILTTFCTQVFGSKISSEFVMVKIA